MTFCPFAAGLRGPRSLAALLFCGAIFCAVAPAADVPRIELEGEAGPFWITRNPVRVPNQAGTTFNMLDLTGRGPWAFGRAYGTVNLTRRQSIRLLAAPLSATGTGTLPQPTVFRNVLFAAGAPTEGTYQFSTYRATYSYAFIDRERWRLKAGASVLVRDAKIELSQGGARTAETDLGLVPLAYFAAQYSPHEKVSFVLDVEGLGASQGRAIDGALKAHYHLTPNISIGLGYRTLEGGANVDRVYNFAWIHYGVASLALRF